MVYLKPFSYTQRIFYSLVRSARDALQNKRLSLTKKRCLPHVIATPCILPLHTVFLIIVLNPCAKNKNKVKEGNLDPKPLSGVQVMMGFPFIRIEYVIEHTHVKTKLIHQSRNPNATMTDSKQSHSTQSYALDISSFSMLYIFPLMLCFIEYNYSCVMVMLLVMRRPSMNALCGLEISRSSSV